MTLRAYYNENDPKAAAWLRELINRDLIAPGDVDERSICDVQASDVSGYTQCHWFAGIGGWSYALRLAGWADERPVWTCSCPCQPYSLAGRRTGTKDHRDLWPFYARLAAEHRPVKMFGEQVASAITHGWLDRLCDDLEAAGYAVGAHVLPACSVGTFHKRERIWWAATSDAIGVRPQGQRTTSQKSWTREQFAGLVQAELRISIPSGTSGGVAHAVPARLVRLRGYGNAIVPDLAAQFIEAFNEVIQFDFPAPVPRENTGDSR